MAVNEPFEDRNGSKFAWIFISFAIGAFIFLIMVLIPKFNDAQLSKLESGQRLDMIDDEDKDFFKYMKPREGFFATPILIYINILVFFSTPVTF